MGFFSAPMLTPPPATPFNKTPPPSRASAGFSFGKRNKNSNNLSSSSFVQTPTTVSSSTPAFQLSQSETPITASQPQQVQLKSKSQPQPQPQSHSASVSLTCLSPDSRSVHSLVVQDGTIQTRFLPIENDNQNDDGPSYRYEDENESALALPEEHKVKQITTALPNYMLRSFVNDAPIELICVDNGMPQPTTSQRCQSRASLPLLMVYTSQSAFTLQITYSTKDEEDTDTKVVEGTVEVTEPFESHLLQHPTSIRRIRAAPNGWHQGGNDSFHNVLSPRGACVLLTSDSQLVIYAGTSTGSMGGDSGPDGSENILKSRLSTPLPQQHAFDFWDFCFLPSSRTCLDHGLWNSWCIVLATNNGTLHAVSPILIEGTIVSAPQIYRALENLTKSVRASEGGGGGGGQAMQSCVCRRNKAALQVLKDAFDLKPSDEIANSRQKGIYYFKTRVAMGQITRNATSWPISIQGPLHIPETEGIISAMECLGFSAAPSIEGKDVDIRGGVSPLVMARGLNELEVCFIPSGNSLLPRFAFEDVDDAQVLNDEICDMGIVIQRIILDESSNGTSVEDDDSGRSLLGSAKRVVIIPDPVDRTIIHHVSARGVATITTNVVEVKEKEMMISLLEEDPSFTASQPKTQFNVESKAWPSIEMSTVDKNMNGVVVSGDASLGHILVVALSDGTFEAINMTAIRYLKETKDTMPEEASSSTSLISLKAREGKEIHEALKTLEARPPFHHVIQPHLSKISEGLAKMGKLVGGETKPHDITPGMLATFLSMKQSCAENVMDPVQELNELTRARTNDLKAIHQHQKLQVKRVQEMIKDLETRMIETQEKRKAVEANARLLERRSAALLDAVRDLAPNLTKAEKDFFQEIRRQDVNGAKWEDAVRKLRIRVSEISNSTMFSGTAIQLQKDEVELCNNLLLGQSVLLKGTNGRVHDIEGVVDKLGRAKGLFNSDERFPLVSISDADRMSSNVTN